MCGWFSYFRSAELLWLLPCAPVVLFLHRHLFAIITTILIIFLTITTIIIVMTIITNTTTVVTAAVFIASAPFLSPVAPLNQPQPKQIPTALEASGAIQPGDVIISVNGIPLPGAGCYRRDAALLVAPGMFPMRLRIHRPKRGSIAPEGMDGEEGLDRGGEGGAGGGLEGSLSRLKQVRDGFFICVGGFPGAGAGRKRGSTEVLYGERGERGEGSKEERGREIDRKTVTHRERGRQRQRQIETVWARKTVARCPSLVGW